MDPFLGEIRIFAGSFAPKDWAICDGSLLPIARYSALYSLLGNTYGGNGQSNFALPDLRGRVPIHQGTGNGLTRRDLGDSDGQVDVRLSQNEVPSHTHTALAVAAAGRVNVAVGNVWAQGPSTGTPPVSSPLYTATATVQMAPDALSVVGGSQTHNNLQPYLGVNFIIALAGVWPTRP